MLINTLVCITKTRFSAFILITYLMFEQIRTDFQGKVKKLNHRNVKSYADLNSQLKKAYQISSSYSLWYEDGGQLLSIQNEYDFQNLDRSKKLKIIVLAEENTTLQSFVQQVQPQKASIEVKPKAKTPLMQTITIKSEQSKCEQCQNFRLCGFTQIVCVDCEKKNMAAMFPPKEEKPVLSIDKQKVKEEWVSVPVRPAKNKRSFTNQQKNQTSAKIIQNKPKITIDVKPSKVEQFKQNQSAISQFFELLNLFKPIKQQDQNNQQPEVNLLDVAKILLNYKPQEQQQAIGGFGKQLSEKYQMMQDIFPNESKEELLEFIGNHMQVAYDDLPNKYMQYKHW